jgi:methylated-DNA-[protein]-cysteine S-methyltransferase
MRVSNQVPTLGFRIVATRAGHVGIVGGARGLRHVYLPQRSRARLRQVIRVEFAEAVEDRMLLPELAAALGRYFDAQRVEFDVRLDFANAGEFDAAVWQACLRVPYGKTISYLELARRAGYPGAARAAGTAMKHNRFPVVVPCHRVIKSDGSLGGYSGPEGVDFKHRLLEMEASANAAWNRGGETVY